jgi:hypothetical protein
MNLFLQESENVFPAMHIVKGRFRITFPAIDDNGFPVFCLFYSVRTGFFIFILFGNMAIIKSIDNVLKFFH